MARALAVLTILGTTLAPVARAQAGDEPGARARTILADPRFQRGAAGDETDSPRPASESGSPAEEGELPLPRDTPPPVPPVPPAPPVPDEVVGGTSDLAAAVSWGFLAVAATLLLVWAIRAWQARRRILDSAAGAPAEKRTATAGGDTAAVTPADADRLAAAGRYAEAVHLLLLAVIGQIAERSRRLPAASQTSRELARLLPLRSEARAAFGELVRDVERSHFGAFPAGREDYEANVRRFLTIVARSPA
jgi:hypothetical protein